jgi:pyruvate dehydrogenase (quinone)
MQMNGLAELLTIRRYWREWSDPRLVVCVFHNNDLSHVTWELRAMGGAPKFEESQTLPEVSYADVAHTMGWRAIAVDNPDSVGPAWEEALAAEEPVLLDVRTDPEVPPIPPHVTYDETRSMIEAILKGDPNGWHVVGEIAKNKAAELFTRVGLPSKIDG